MADISISRFERPDKSATPAFDHAEYVERDGAAEVIESAQEGYIARPGAIERIGYAAGLGEFERAALGVPELDGLGPSPQVAEGLAIVSNISDDMGERQHFWQTVEQHERESRTVTFRARPWEAPAWWDELHQRGIPDKKFEAYLLGEQGRYKAHAAMSNRPFKAASYKMPTADAERLFGQLRAVAPWLDVDVPVRTRTRSGRTQFRFVIELPAGISPHDRMAIARDFCAKLEQLERNEQGAAIGMMYTAVIHAPDAHNDKRNYHLHVIAHDRPCKFLVEHGEWDFAVPESYIHRGQRRTRYPYRQNKLTVSQSRRVTGWGDSGKHFLKTLRTMFADSANHVLAARKADRRLHPGTYADCGIEREPTKHLGGMYRAEQIGIATVRGDENAAVIWADRAREIYTNNLNRRIAVLWALDRVAGATKAYADAAALRELQEIEARMAGEAKSLLALKLEYDLFRLNEEKARSRANVVRSHCDEQIDGRASDTVRSRREREDLIRRRAEAMSYLEALDRDMAAERERLATIGRSLMARDTQLTKDLAAVDRLIGRLASEEAAREATRLAVAEDHTDASDMPLPPAASPAMTSVRIGASEKAAAPRPHSGDGTHQRDRPERLSALSASPAARASADESPPPSTLADSCKVEPATAHAGHASSTKMALGVAADGTEDSKPDVAITGSEAAAGGPLRAVPNTKIAEPAVTPQPSPALPIRLGGKMSDGHRRIDILLKRIAEQRLEVVRTNDVTGDQYAVPALHAELAALRTPSQMMRINLALKARYRLQEREIDRLIGWIGAVDPANAAGLDAALARAPKAIQTLYANLRNHERLSAFLTAIQKSGGERGAPVATVPKPGKVGKPAVSTSGPKASPAAEEGGGKPSRAAMTEETRVAVSRDQGDADFQLLAPYQHLLGGRGR